MKRLLPLLTFSLLVGCHCSGASTTADSPAVEAAPSSESPAQASPEAEPSAEEALVEANPESFPALGAEETEQERPRNVVFLIGDGMGPVHERAASLFLHGEGGRLQMNAAPVQTTITTHAADQAITDSAASAAAFATGHKVNYEVVSLDPVTGDPLMTVLEELSAAGFETGLVTTSRISHATPAAFAAHVPSRYDEREIWQQMLRTQPTLLFGGGTPGLTTERLVEAGYETSTSAVEMQALDPGADRWSMIFGRDHIPYVLDGLGTAPSLPLMTGRALALLEDADTGFFLLIEGARIDHASHDNDFERMIPEMLAFDESLTVVLDWASERDDTLVLLTADHECGGLSIVHEEGQGRLSRVEWSTTGHTGVPVNLYAWGPFADEAAEVTDNTHVHRLLRLPLEQQ